MQKSPLMMKKVCRLLQSRFAFPVQCRCLSMQKGKHPIFTLTMVCTMSSTTTLVTLEILKSHWFRLSLRQTFSARSWMKRAFSRKPIPQKYRSLHCCLNSAAIRIKFGTVCSVALPLVRQQNPAPLRTKRKLKQKRCL